MQWPEPRGKKSLDLSNEHPIIPLSPANLRVKKEKKTVEMKNLALFCINEEKNSTAVTCTIVKAGI